MKPIFQNCKIVGDNVNNSDYMRQSVERGHTEYAMSRSSLMDLLKCPHKWIQGVSDSETKSTAWGTLVDCLLLTPDKFEGQFVICPAEYKSDAMQCPICKTITDSKSCRNCKAERVKIQVSKPWSGNADECREWIAKQNGKIVVKSDDYSAAQKAVKIVRETKLPSGVEIGEIVDSSRKQVMVMGEYKDAATGLIIPVKALLDLVPQTSHAGISNGTEDDLKRMASRFGLLIPFSKCIADFKTAQSADCDTWPSHVFKFDYDAQGWMQLEMYCLATGEDRTDFFNIVQESEPPYEVSNPLPLYTSEMLEQGRSKILAALKLYCQCLKSKLWPSYGWNIPNSNRCGDFYRVEPSLWQQEQVLNLQHEYRTGGLPEIKRLETELADAPLN